MGPLYHTLWCLSLGLLDRLVNLAGSLALQAGMVLLSSAPRWVCSKAATELYAVAVDEGVPQQHCCWTVSACSVSVAVTLLGVEEPVMPLGSCQLSHRGTWCMKGTSKKKRHLVWNPGRFQAPTWWEIMLRKLCDNWIAFNLSLTCSVSSLMPFRFFPVLQAAHQGGPDMLSFLLCLVESKHIYKSADALGKQGRKHWLCEQAALVFQDRLG